MGWGASLLDTNPLHPIQKRDFTNLNKQKYALLCGSKGYDVASITEKKTVYIALTWLFFFLHNSLPSYPYDYIYTLKNTHTTPESVYKYNVGNTQQNNTKTYFRTIYAVKAFVSVTMAILTTLHQICALNDLTSIRNNLDGLGLRVLSDRCSSMYQIRYETQSKLDLHQSR